jgi:hypothetical protein
LNLFFASVFVLLSIALFTYCLCEAAKLKLLRLHANTIEATRQKALQTQVELAAAKEKLVRAKGDKLKPRSLSAGDGISNEYNIDDAIDASPEEEEQLYLSVFANTATLKPLDLITPSLNVETIPTNPSESTDQQTNINSKDHSPDCDSLKPPTKKKKKNIEEKF